MSNFMQYVSITKIRKLHERYEAHMSAVAVTFGFIVDSLTLQRIDLLVENVVIIAYLLIAGLAIIVMNLHHEGKLEWQVFEHADWWVTLLMQFAFGGLFSVFLLFYGRAGSLAASWPLFLVLLGLLVGNEIFRTRYRQLNFHISVWYVALLAYLIFAVPILLNTIGWWVFLIAGVASIGIAYGFVSLLSFASPQRVEREKTVLTYSIGGIFVLVNLLYFLNIMPPIPLSLKEGQVAHNVQRQHGGYLLDVETVGWFGKLTPRETVHIHPPAPVYFYSSVFAPTDLETNIVHEWQYFNPRETRWRVHSRITFPITGGRGQGYRGYSFVRNPAAGRWRVSVETPSGQVLGRDRFHVEHVNDTPTLERIEK